MHRWHLRSEEMMLAYIHDSNQIAAFVINVISGLVSTEILNP